MRTLTYINEYGDSVTFGVSAPYYLHDIDASSLGTDRTTQKTIGQHGETTTALTYKQRSIVAKLGCIGIKDGRYNQQAFDAAWQQICSVIVPAAKGTLVYTNDVGTYRIDCSPNELPNPQRDIATKYSFAVDFIADVPFWRAEHPFVHRLGQVVGGKRYPLRYPLRYGEWVRDVTVINDTNIATPVVVEITSEATEVLVTNMTTGEYIKVETPLTQGQKMVIDTGKYTVEIITYDELGKETSREYANYRITLDSTYFRLSPGRNHVTLDNGYPDALASASITYDKLYLGV